MRAEDWLSCIRVDSQFSMKLKEHGNINASGSKLTRRMFIGLAGNAALMLGLGGLVRVIGRQEPTLRPPGALPEEQFISACIKCQRCAEVCPTGVITQGILAENILGFGTPRLSFCTGYCTLCAKCIEVCPTGALAAGPGRTVIAGVAEINATSCIAWSWGGCTKCQQVCPTHAIVLDPGERPVINADLCNGCGRCEFECPSPFLRSSAETGGKGITVVPLTVDRSRAASKSLFPVEDGNCPQRQQSA